MSFTDSSGDPTGVAAFANSYELSPIIFVGGVAGNISGGKLPISQVMQSDNWPGGPTGPSAGGDSSTFFAHFYPFGGQLARNEVARWPLANMAVAANDVIAQPLLISLRMTAPGNPDTGVSYAGKQAVMTALQATIAQHTALGGWYDVATPSYLYQGCLLLNLRETGGYDESGGQAQVEWIWEFEQPLITLAAAQGAYNQAMQKVAAQTANSGDPPGSQPLQTTAGAPSANVTGSVIPGASGLTAAQGTSSTPGSPAPPLTAVSPIPPGS